MADPLLIPTDRVSGSPNMVKQDGVYQVRFISPVAASLKSFYSPTTTLASVNFEHETKPL